MCALAFGSAVPVAAQTPSEVTLDLSPQLFTVLTALRVGTDDLQHPFLLADTPVGRAVEQRLRQLPQEVTAPLHDFFGPGKPSEVSSYVSLALSLNGPPDFTFRLPEDKLPPDAFQVAELQPLLKDFYANAGLATLWRQVVFHYEQAIAAEQPELARTLLESRGYLRMISQSYSMRSYRVYLEWLVPPGLTSARNYGDDYFLVIHPSRDDLNEAVRHQYLHFLLDSLVAKHTSDLSSWTRLQPIAERAPRLPEVFRKDLILLVSESLIQAIELRLLNGDDAAQKVSEAEAEGFIFVPYFHQALAEYEQSEPSFRYYFPEMIKGFSVASTEGHLQQVNFAAAEPEPQPRPERGTPVPADPSTILLREAEAQLRAGDYPAAQASFERVLREFKDHEPRALFGLAIVASARQDPEQAKYHFLLTLEHTREPSLLGWSHVYLGRIYDMEGDRERAVSHYRAALALGTKLPKVEEAARNGLAVPFGAPKRSQDTVPDPSRKPN